jgi:uncharacterized protein YaiE (UPF0345 family)
MQLNNVTAVAKANIYFDGKVISHTVLLGDGSKKTLGVILPGSYHFGTDAAERMEVVEGACKVTLDGSACAVAYAAGSAFDVPAKSGFTIAVEGSPCHYICSFLA